MDASEVDRLSDVEQKQRRDVTGNGVAHSATNGSPGLGCHENTALPRNAERLARTLIDRIGGAITRPRQEFLDEDYLVFTITRVEDAESAAYSCSMSSSMRISPQLQRGGWLYNWRARRYSRAARQVHSLFIDVNELTDRTENAVKIVGDVYAARLFAMAAARLGLN